MYPLALAAHSLLRWIILALGVAAVGRAVAGRRGAAWTSGDERTGRWLVIALDVQFLLGLGLYLGLSPMTRLAFEDFGAAMGNAVLRFWAVEHIFGMLVALGLAHVGRVRILRLTDAGARHRTAAIFFGLALVVMILTIPWPGTPAARPLFRLP
jgi:hypothetical protein